METFTQERRLTGYAKVWSLGHRAIPDIFDGPVVVQEKIDGSQISFARYGSRLYVRSKGQMLVDGADNVESLTVGGMFECGVRSIAERFGRMQDGFVYRGEFLQRPKHNTLTYSRVPTGHIVIFDVTDTEGNYVAHSELVDEAVELDLDAIPQLYAGIVEDVEQLFEFLELESYLGGPKIEGIVVKRHDRLTQFGDAMFGKYVSEAFKEKHTKDWKDRNPNKRDVIENIIAMYGTEGRWRKAIQHLAERGEITNDPRDIGPLMKEIASDFEEECADEVIAMLWTHFRRDIIRGVSRGFPEWYKRELASWSFTGDDTSRTVVRDPLVVPDVAGRDLR